MRLRTFFFLCLILPFLAGWGHWGPEVKVGFSLDNAKGREALIKDMNDEMADNRGDLLLRDAKGDSATQEAQVKDLIAQGIQALVVIPADPAKAAHLLYVAHQAGIKVISLERPIPGCGLDYFIAFNQEKAGELQAAALVKKVSQGRYILLGDTMDWAGSLRDGQRKVLNPLIGRGDILIGYTENQHPEKSSTPEEIAKALEPLFAGSYNNIKTNPPGPNINEKMKAVLTSDNVWSEGVVRALQKNGLSGKVPLAGDGEDLETCRRIASGTQTLTIYHSPKKLAAETAYLAAKLARKATEFDCQFTDVDNGGVTTKAVLLTPMVVDAKNLDSTIISDGVQKREEVYGK